MTASSRTGKTGSKNPANRATSVAAWKKSALPDLVEMPSGNYMRIRKIGLQAIIKTGTLPNSLMGIAEKAVGRGNNKPHEVTDEELVALIQDPKKVEEIASFMDKIMVMCAAEPSVSPVPRGGVDRNPEVLYVDEIDEEDKMFVFQVVTGGTTDVEAFRLEHSSTMADIRRRQNLELPAE